MRAFKFRAPTAAAIAHCIHIKVSTHKQIIPPKCVGVSGARKTYQSNASDLPHTHNIIVITKTTRLSPYVSIDTRPTKTIRLDSI